MSIQTRSTATLLARFQELQREEEEIVTELRRRAAENEPEDDDEDGDEVPEANEPVQLAEEPNLDRFQVARGGNRRTISGHRLEAEFSGLTFTTDNEAAPNWQVADWPPLPFDLSEHNACDTSVASVVVQNPAAGHNSKSGTSTVVVLSTHNESNMVHFLEVDDTTQNLCWRIRPSMNRTRLSLAAVVCRGYLYAIGGMCMNSEERLDTMERIDIQELLGSSLHGSPSTNNQGGWTTLECHLSEKRWGCSAAVVKERFIVVAGGEGYMSTHTSIDILDTAASSTQNPCGVSVLAGPPMNIRRTTFAMAVIGSRIYAVGGFNHEEDVLRSVEYLELDDWVLEGPEGGPQRSIVISPSNEVSFCWTNTWRNHPQLALYTPRSFIGMVRVGSCLVVAGGEDGTENGSRSVQVLDTERNSSWELPDMIEERSGCTMVAHSTTGIVAIGGSRSRTCERLPLVDQKSACFARCMALGRAPRF